MTVSATTDYSIELEMWLDNHGRTDGKAAAHDRNLVHYIEVLNPKTKPLTVEVFGELPQANPRLRFKGHRSLSKWHATLHRIPSGQSDRAGCDVEVIGSTGKERVECMTIKYESQWNNGVWHSCSKNLPLSMTVEVV